jgi:hypothetical protein
MAGHDASPHEFDAFVARWLAPIVAVLLRVVHDPVLAFDLTTESLAAARVTWPQTPDADDRLALLLGSIAPVILADAAARGEVPATERSRGRRPPVQTLTARQQRELTMLAEARLELPSDAQAAAEALARSAPPAHVLARLRGSRLVDAEPLPDDRANVS